MHWIRSFLKRRENKELQRIKRDRWNAVQACTLHDLLKMSLTVQLLKCTNSLQSIKEYYFQEIAVFS